jgi:hypothetical protein
MIEILQPVLDNNISNKIIYPVRIDRKLYEFYIHYDVPYTLDLNMNIDCIVVMLTSIAICNKWKIVSKLSIDEKLYNNLMQLPNTYKKYHSKHTSLLSMVKYEELNLVLEMPKCNRSSSKKELRREIRNKNESGTPRLNPEGKGYVGLRAKITSLSMGVDSLHTILFNKHALSHLIYINNMDLSNTIPHFNKLLQKVSNKYDKKLIIANSNFKQMTMSLKLNNSISMPGTNYAVFTSDAILLASSYPLGLKKMYFSGFGSKNFPCLMGQHSEINKYFNSSEFVCIANEVERVRKINFIVKNDEEIIKHIRVCNDPTTTKCANCSKCRKCITTIMYFYILGYYDILKDSFLLPSKEKIKNHLVPYEESKLSSVYFNKIFEEYVKLYNANQCNSLNNIIENYSGDFINDNYFLRNVLPRC